MSSVRSRAGDPLPMFLPGGRHRLSRGCGRVRFPSWAPYTDSDWIAAGFLNLHFPVRIRVSVPVSGCSLARQKRRTWNAKIGCSNHLTQTNLGVNLAGAGRGFTNRRCRVQSSGRLPAIARFSGEADRLSSGWRRDRNPYARPTSRRRSDPGLRIRERGVSTFREDHLPWPPSRDSAF